VRCTSDVLPNRRGAKTTTSCPLRASVASSLTSESRSVKESSSAMGPYLKGLLARAYTLADILPYTASYYRYWDSNRLNTPTRLHLEADEAKPTTTTLARLRGRACFTLRARRESPISRPSGSRLGPERFFSEHGFARATTYELVWDASSYPPKAILGTAYEFATGQRLASGDFEGGKSGAVRVLGKLGFTVQPARRPAGSS
jgi:hypothetical protein